MTKKEERVSVGALTKDPDGVAFGPLFFEKFLLAVIAAHPDVDGTPRQRLDEALRSLVGHKSSRNPPHDDPEDEALVFMAGEHVRDKIARASYEWDIKQGRTTPSTKPKIRSTKKLAEQAADRWFPDRDASTKKAIVDRLREKSSGTYQKGKLGADPAIDFKRTYQYRAIDHDYIEESLEHQGLQRLQDEFAKWGVALKL